MADAQIWQPEWLAGVAAPQEATAASKFRDESGWNVYVHEEFLTWFADPATANAQRKRARYCLRELLVSGQCARRKHVQGAGKGWLRTQLGGTGGSHYYLWWAPYGYPAVDSAGLEPNDVLVRVVRHHDDTDKPLDPGQRPDRHIIDAAFVLDVTDPDLTEEQLEAAAPVGAPVRLVRGFPGSGKTTALLQAGSHSWGAKALYLTFSKRLASESEKHFQTFAPIDTTTDVMTFGELLVELGADPDDAVLVPTIGIDAPQVRHAFQLVKGQLGPWSERPTELYAELHAHALGRALPVAFKGLPASPDGIVDPDALAADRAPTLGVPASNALAAAARHVRDAGLLDGLFPTIRAARSALDRSGASLPARFDGVSAVLIDEVQDLTAVEAMLVLTVAARIGHASGRMPQLIIAGDEAQTVRPTAFKWSLLADLVTLVLGGQHAKRSDISLKENLRSPRSIGLLIEATRSHYRLLDKDQRPGGLNYAESESETDGKVLYCHVPLATGWTELTSIFDEQPSAQLVYPGSEVPAELVETDADVALSDQVKGLDFDLVGVIDAGERQLELQALAAKAEDDPLSGALGRTIADQFRVAVSRSRENLVLIDRGIEDRSAAIHELMTEVSFDPVVSVGLEQLASELKGDVNPLDRLSAQLDDVAAILEDDPVRALAKARTAVDILRQAQDADDVPPPQVLATHRLLGLACALSAPWHEKQGEASEAALRRQEAKAALELAGLGGAFVAASAIEASVGTRPVADIDPAIVLTAVEAYPEVSRELAPLEPWLRSALVRWVEVAAEDGLPSGARLPSALSAIETTVELLSRRQPEISNSRYEALARTAGRAEEARAFDDALLCYRDYETPPVDDIGRCLEELGRWDEAADLYEGEARGADALRCVRQIPDLDRAITLAEQVEPEVVGRLRWARSLVERVDATFTDDGAPLTPAESAHVLAVLQAGVQRSIDSVPSADAAVDRVDPVGGSASPAAQGDLLVPAAATPAPGVSAPELPGLEPPTGPEPLKLDLGEAPGLTALAALGAEIGMTADDMVELARKLGVRAVGDDLLVTQAQADRLRRRVASTRAGD